MDSQDKRMCGTVDYDHEVYDEDCFGDILNILDLPMENLEGDGLAEDWASKLGPIPSEVFKEMLPPVSQIVAVNGNGNGGGGGGGCSADSLMECSVLNVETSQPNRRQILDEKTVKCQPKQQQPTFSQEKMAYPLPRSFEAPSPDSVLERSSSGATGKLVSFRNETPVPVRTRTKRSRPRPTANPWSTSFLLVAPNEEKKRRRNLSQQPASEIKKCSHCEITKTPQWREGPMGPKTLCNACGVRYRSGRLFPEYRPAASPTFIPSVHSNSHRKVIEIRQKGGVMDDNYVMMTKKPNP